MSPDIVKLSMRKKKKEIDDSAAALLESKIEAQNGPIVDKQKVSVRLKQGTLETPYMRKDGVKTISTSMTVPIELWQKLSVHCATTGRKKSFVIAKAIETYLE